MNPLVSIIIPTYKRNEWLIDCLQALAKQDYPLNQFEVIVIDDSSPDAEEKKTEVLALRYPFALTYQIQPKGGPAKARNLGLSLAKNSLILFTDDDAIPQASWVRELVDTLSEGRAAGVSGFTLSYKVETWTERYLDHVNHLSKHHYGTGEQLAYIITVNAGFLKSALDEIHGFDETFPFPSGEDMDLGFRLRQKGHQLISNPKALVYHRQRESLTRMIKTWFIYGRGAYMCAIKNKDVSHLGVTSSQLKETSKIKNTLFKYFQQLINNVQNKDMKWFDKITFPHLEIANHVAYQLGRIYEHVFSKK